MTRGRARLLDACLASLQAQNDPRPFEVLVSTDGDPAVEETVKRRFPGAAVSVAGRALPGAARNFLVRQARGEWLLFLDDDVIARPDLLRSLATLIEEHPDVAVLGGPNETPGGSSLFQWTQGAVLASIVTSGPVRRRYGRHPAGPADERFFILCNLAIKREAILPFPDDLVCAEENALMSEMSRRGLAMHYDPELVVYHERRPNLPSFAAQMLKYGRGRGQLLVRKPFTFRPAYLPPVALVAYLVALPLLTISKPVTLVPLGIYFAVIVAGGAKVARTLRRLAAWPIAMILMLTVHICYGFGLLQGLFMRRRSRWPLRPVDNRESTDILR